jgi:hypothetical protein
MDPALVNSTIWGMILLTLCRFATRLRNACEEVGVIDLIYLTALRSRADEVRSDLERRQERQRLEEDRQFADDMAAKAAQSDEPLPLVVYKRFCGEQPYLNNKDDSVVVDPLVLTDDDLMEVIANALAQTRMEFRDEIDAATAVLNQRIVVLEGKFELLTSLLTSVLGNNNNGVKSFEASEIVRKVRVP